MFYIVGLGNPGEKYSHTRHNVGFFAITAIQEVCQLPNFVMSSALSGAISEGMMDSMPVALLKPMTYMNHSGSSVVKLVPKKDVGCLIVLYDDVDLAIGEFKISVGRGSGGHNGVQSIIDSIGSKQFIRLRVGVARKGFWSGAVKRPPADRLAQFVLQKFSTSEISTLEAEIPTFVSVLKTIMNDGAEQAMNEYN